jgi:hypothetical protein
VIARATPFSVPITEVLPPGKLIGVRLTENVVVGNALAGAAGAAVWANPASDAARQRNARARVFICDFLLESFTA